MTIVSSHLLQLQCVQQKGLISPTQDWATGSGDLHTKGLLSAQEGKVAFSAFVGVVAPVSTLWTEENRNVTNVLGCQEPFSLKMCFVLH